MSEELKRTYVPFGDWSQKSIQREYTEPTELVDEDGTLLAAGWARKNVFKLDRTRVPRLRLKEWEFYQVSNDRYMMLFSVATTARLAGYCTVNLVDYKAGKNHIAPMLFFGGAGKHNSLSDACDVPSHTDLKLKHGKFEIITENNSRILKFKTKNVECCFQMDIMDRHDNITTVLPFKDMPKRFFMTTKQNCMPAEGYFRKGDMRIDFSKEDSFCTLDWGRVAAPRRLVWYWGNGSSFITDENGKKHLFGFEITWAIGDESKATETCLFWDGVAHKIGAVDVEAFPKGRYMEPWHIISEDGRFDMTMTPFYDNHSRMNVGILDMNCHQVHGYWSGSVVLDDGTKLELKDMYAFCEYCENKW